MIIYVDFRSNFYTAKIKCNIFMLVCFRQEKRIFNEDISIFEYNCEKITSLDDIFISLNQFINNARFRTDNDLKNRGSIDEKIITFFKKQVKYFAIVY